MSMPAYVTIKTTTGTNLTAGAGGEESLGNAVQSDHADESIVYAVMANVTIPRDPLTGQPSGLRRHEPTTLTKVFDKASPQLWTALCEGTPLEITLKFYRVAKGGGIEQYYTITWTNAILVDGKGYLPNALDKDNGQFGNMEDWSFTYSKVVWNHVAAKVEGSDDWSAPKTA